MRGLGRLACRLSAPVDLRVPGALRPRAPEY
jgi:hypothetical protein